MVDNKVTCDYDLAEGHILGWGYLREVVASKDFVASFWPRLARISHYLLAPHWRVLQS